MLHSAVDQFKKQFSHLEESCDTESHKTAAGCNCIWKKKVMFCPKKAMLSSRPTNRD